MASLNANDVIAVLDTVDPATISGVLLWMGVPHAVAMKKYRTPDEKKQAGIKDWLEHDPNPSWRRVIAALDCMKEFAASERIKGKAEPNPEASLTKLNVMAALRTVEQFPYLASEMGIPGGVGNNPDGSVDRVKCIEYFVLYVPNASWAFLAGACFLREEKRPLEAMQKHLNKTKDPTLTLHNVCELLKNISNWPYLATKMFIPVSKQMEIKAKYGADEVTGPLKEAVEFWLENFPAPSWKILIQSLHLYGLNDNPNHGLAMTAATKYAGTPPKPKAAKKMTSTLELSFENVMDVLDRVEDTQVRLLGIWLMVPFQIISNPMPIEEKKGKIVEYWLENDPTPSWRRLIWAVESMHVTEVAESIAQYAEPIEDPSLTIDNITEVLQHVESMQYLCPELKIPVVAGEDLAPMRDLGLHWLERVPNASWEVMAGALLMRKEEEAMKVAKRFVKKVNDPTLTMENLTAALQDTSQLQWAYFCSKLYVPTSVQSNIKTTHGSNTAKCLEAALSYWKRNHPSPSWAMLEEALFSSGSHDILKKVRMTRRQSLGAISAPQGRKIDSKPKTKPRPPPIKPKPVRVKSLSPEPATPPISSAKPALMVAARAQKGPVVIPFKDIEVGEAIGEGSFGVVRKGYWRTSDGKRRLVAIKQLKGVDKNEVKILGSLDHPNIITLYGTSQTGDASYLHLITDYAENGSLEAFFSKHPCQPELKRSLAWAKQIANGMLYLHHRGFVHRDLKSNNVVLTSDWVAKICDLGTARTLEHTMNMTSTGTSAWIAPEITLAQPASKKCDVYSYGVILWELATHDKPFRGIPPLLIPSEVIKGERPPIPDTTDEALKDLIQQCWQNEPEARPVFESVLYSLEECEVGKMEFGELEVTEEIGSGAFGIVSKGFWNTKRGGRILVAIKKLTDGDEKEVKALSSLRHPRITHFYGWVKSPHLRLISLVVTEFAENGSVEGYIKARRGKPEKERTLLWGREIAEGMQYIHERGFAHRDLKSSNVVLTSNWSTKICDMGTAKLLKKTVQMTLAGTFAWMAPELMMEEPASKKCDVYSYAIVLWELVTFQVPYDGVAPLMIAPKVINGERPTIPDDCEQFLRDLMKRCWVGNYKERPTFDSIMRAWDQ